MNIRKWEELSKEEKKTIMADWMPFCSDDVARDVYNAVINLATKQLTVFMKSRDECVKTLGEIAIETGTGWWGGCGVYRRAFSLSDLSFCGRTLDSSPSREGFTSIRKAWPELFEERYEY